MKSPLIVGILGHKRAGKDSAASTLVDRLGLQRASFADPLKAAAIRLDPIVHGDCEGGMVRLSAVVAAMGWEDAKDRYPEVRVILQRLGTDAIRTLDPDFWVRMAVGKLDPDTGYVFTDVRFPNEVQAIKNAGGVTVRVRRTEADKAAELDTHPSEHALDSYLADFSILNDGDLHDLGIQMRIAVWGISAWPVLHL